MHVRLLLVNSDNQKCTQYWNELLAMQSFETIKD